MSDMLDRIEKIIDPTGSDAAARHKAALVVEELLKPSMEMIEAGRVFDPWLFPGQADEGPVYGKIWRAMIGAAK